MKTFILTSIKPTISEFDRNYDLLLNYVRENFEGLLIGAKRREKCFSNQISIVENDCIIIIKRGDLPSISLSVYSLLYNAQKVTCERNLHEIYIELVKLKDFAEDPEGSKYSYKIEKEDEDLFL